MRRFRSKIVAMAALAAALCLGIAGLAYSASNHAISGTVYSGCSGEGPWYVSSIARTKEGTGLIKAQFSVINNGGLTFKLQDKHNQQIGNQQSWTKTETEIWRTLADSVPHGTVFHTAFRSTDYGCWQWKYNFSGTLFY